MLLALCPARALGAESAKKKEVGQEKSTDSASSKKTTKADKKTTKADKTKPKKPNKASSPPPSGSLRPGEAASVMFFFDGGIRHDSGTFSDKQETGPNEQEEYYDIKAFGPLFHFGLIKKLGKNVGLGAAFGYGMNYNISQRLTKEERDNEEEPERWRMGQLLSLDARFEWSGHVTDKVAIAVTPLVGITTVIPGGDLRDRTEEADESHFIGPRLGFVVGGELGVRYYLTDWFSLKAGVGFNYFIQQLLHAKARGEIANSKLTWKVSASRLTSGLALEASF